MQQLAPLARTVPPHVTMEILIDRHGAWTALRAFLRALTGRRKRRVELNELTDHIRRDIGLAERGEPPPEIRGPWM